MATFRALDVRLAVAPGSATAERSLELSNTIEFLLEITPEMGIRARSVTLLPGGQQLIELEDADGRPYGSLEADARIPVQPGEEVTLDWSLAS